MGPPPPPPCGPTWRNRGDCALRTAWTRLQDTAPRWPLPWAGGRPHQCGGTWFRPFSEVKEESDSRLGQEAGRFPWETMARDSRWVAPTLTVRLTSGPLEWFFVVDPGCPWGRGGSWAAFPEMDRCLWGALTSTGALTAPDRISRAGEGDPQRRETPLSLR